MTSEVQRFAAASWGRRGRGFVDEGVIRVSADRPPAHSNTVGSAPVCGSVKPTYHRMPLQRGLFWDWPQRQRASCSSEAPVLRGAGLPPVSVSSTPPVMRCGPPLVISMVEDVSTLGE